MTQISNLGAALFTSLSVAVPSTPLSRAQMQALDTADEFNPLFAKEIDSQGGVRGAGTFVQIKNIREFPAIGTAANIVKVPEYGSRTSKQIQGQSDLANMEIKLNYIPADWAKEATNILGSMVGDGNTYVFRETFMNVDSTGTGDTKLASSAAGIGTVENSSYFFIGKLEALQVTPSLTDTTQATLTLTVQSETYGAFTV